MPTIQVQLSNVKRNLQPDGTPTNNVSFVAIVIGTQNKQIIRNIDVSNIDTWEDFATWLIVQEPEFVLMPAKEKLLEITFHTETAVDDFGEEAPTMVLDDVTVLT